MQFRNWPIDRFVAAQNERKLIFTAGPASLLPENLTGLRPCFGRGDADYAAVEEWVLNSLRSLTGHQHIVRLQVSSSLALELMTLNFLNSRVLVVETGYYSNRLKWLAESAARRAGAGPDLSGALAVTPVVAHIAVVGGRGAAAALGAALALDPAATGIVLPAVVGGALAKRAALGAMVAALALPFVSLALGRRRTAAWCAALPAVMAGARLRGSEGAPPPTRLAVVWERFWFDREPAVDTGGVGTPSEG